MDFTGSFLAGFGPHHQPCLIILVIWETSFFLLQQRVTVYPIPYFLNYQILKDVCSGFAIIFHGLIRSDYFVVYLLIPVGQIPNRYIEQRRVHKKNAANSKLYFFGIAIPIVLRPFLLKKNESHDGINGHDQTYQSVISSHIGIKHQYKTGNAKQKR